MRLLIALALVGILASPAGATQFSTQTSVQPLSWTMTMCDTIATANNNRYVISDWALWKGLVSIDFTSDQAGSLYWWNADSTQFADKAAYISPRRCGGDCDSIPVVTPDSCTIWFKFKADEVVTITSKEVIDSLEVYNTSGSTANIRLIGQRR